MTYSVLLIHSILCYRECIVMVQIVGSDFLAKVSVLGIIDPKKSGFYIVSVLMSVRGAGEYTNSLF